MSISYRAGRWSWARRANARRSSVSALDVAALDVGDADRELGQALPQHPFIVRAVLPCGLEHLVRVECQAPVQQVLGVREGLGRRLLEVIWDAWNSLTALRKWPAESVTRAGASRGPPGVPNRSRSRRRWALQHRRRAAQRRHPSGRVEKGTGEGPHRGPTRRASWGMGFLARSVFPR
jgi:hypothetical protein